MRRRQFFKMAALLPVGTMPQLPPFTQVYDVSRLIGALQEISLITYGDSENTPPAQLAQLGDGDTTSGGVEYQG